MQGKKSKSLLQSMPASFAHQGARAALALAISAGFSLPSLAQGPVTDMDNWIRFPPRPRSPALVPSETATATPAPVTPTSTQNLAVSTSPNPAAPASTSTPTPSLQPVANALAATPSPSQASSPRDSWVQFPIRSATPAVMNVPPLQTQAPTQLFAPVTGTPVTKTEVRPDFAHH